MADGKREFVIRDQVLSLHILDCSLLLVVSRYFHAKNCFSLFLSDHLLFFRNSQLESAVCRLQSLFLRYKPENLQVTYF